MDRLAASRQGQPLRLVELVLPDDPAWPVEAVARKAVMARQHRCTAWRELRDAARCQYGWRQGRR